LKRWNLPGLQERSPGLSLWSAAGSNDISNGHKDLQLTAYQPHPTMQVLSITADVLFSTPPNKTQP